MAQFEPFDQTTEVSGRVVEAAINAINIGAEFRTHLLETHGINHPQPYRWYPQSGFLQMLETLGDQCGNSMLFAVGKAIPYSVKFGDSGLLDLALKSIQLEYEKNHRNGQIGSYDLTGYDAQNRLATVKCYNPYPSHFDRGLLFFLAERYEPEDSHGCSVRLDPNAETRRAGGDSCTYHVRW